MWSNNSAAPFLLTGFLGSEAIQHWISIPFFIIYLSILLVNGTLLFLIWNDSSLHERMYYFLAMLAGTDLGMTLTTVPTVLGVQFSRGKFPRVTISLSPTSFTPCPLWNQVSCLPWPMTDSLPSAPL